MNVSDIKKTITKAQREDIAVCGPTNVTQSVATFEVVAGKPTKTAKQIFEQVQESNASTLQIQFTKGLFKVFLFA